MGYKNMNNKAIYPNKRECQDLLYKISMLDFALVDLMLYLDTHLDDEEAMEYFNHFNMNLMMLKKEYTMQYGPLKVENCADNNQKIWQWALTPMPLEGVV